MAIKETYSKVLFKILQKALLATSPYYIIFTFFCQRDTSLAFCHSSQLWSYFSSPSWQSLASFFPAFPFVKLLLPHQRNINAMPSKLRYIVFSLTPFYSQALDFTSPYTFLSFYCLHLFFTNFLDFLRPLYSLVAEKVRKRHFYYKKNILQITA